MTGDPIGVDTKTGDLRFNEPAEETERWQELGRALIEKGYVPKVYTSSDGDEVATWTRPGPATALWPMYFFILGIGILFLLFVKLP